MRQRNAEADRRIIGKEAEELARGAMVSDYWIATDVRCVYLDPLEELETHVSNLYPVLSTPPEANETTKSRVIRALTQRMQRPSVSKSTGAEDESLASSFVGLLSSRDVELFELVDHDHSHPHAGFSYWTAWILALDRPLGRSVALALGASD